MQHRKTLSPEQIEKIIELTDSGTSRPQIAEDVGVSKGAVYYHQRKENRT